MKVVSLNILWSNMKLIAVAFFLAFNAILFFAGCNDCNNDCIQANLACDCCPLLDSNAAIIPKPDVKDIFVFLETSGSMAGFMPQSGTATTFQKVIPDLLSRLQSNISKPQFYAITESNKSPIAFSSEQARDLMLKGGFQWGSFTSVPLMLDTVNNYRNGHSVSILISDMIYSPDNPREVDQAVTRIREKIGNSPAASLISVYSNYKSKLSYLESPYYILIQGSPDNINATKAHVYKALSTYQIDFEELNFGFQYSAPYYSIVPYSELSNNGIASPCNYDFKRYLQIRDIDTHDTLSFWVAVNLNGLPSYAKSVNYLKAHLLTNESGVNADLIEVTDYSGFISRLSSEETDKLIADTCTHFVRYKVYDFAAKIGVLNLSLLNDRPSWIDTNSHTIIDSIDSKRDRTYGLDYVFTAFQQKFESKPGDPFFNPLQITLLKK